MPFSTKRWLLLVLIVLLSITNKLNAQKGEIIGIIVDEKNKETLIGANVVIQGTAIGNSTDIDGKFKIEDVAPGTYNLEVSFISYKPRVIENVNVKAGQVTDLGMVFMEEDLQMLEGVTVNERRKTDTDISMVSSIQQSNITVSGISRQQISRSLDKNAAEAIRRVPGITIVEGRFVIVRGLIDRYNTVWLNNASTPSSEADKKAFSFDVIPASALDRIMIYKTPAPDLPADFAGASIQIYTKNLPDKNSMSVGYKAGFRQGTSFTTSKTYHGSSTDWLGFDDGTRAIPDDMPTTAELAELHNWEDLGLPQEEMQAILDAKRAKIIDAGTSFNKIWDPIDRHTSLDHSLSFDMSRKFKIGNVDAGNITSISYRNDNLNTDVYKGNFLYNEELGVIDTNFSYKDAVYVSHVDVGVLTNFSFLFGKNTILEFRNLFNQIGDKKYTYRTGYDFYREVNVRSHELAFTSRSLYSGQLGLKHDLSENAKLDGTVGFAYTNRKLPDIRRVYSTLNENQNSDHYGEYAVQFINDATPELNGRLFLGLDERIYTATANYEHKLDFGTWTPSLKTGVYYETKNRQFNARNLGFIKGKVNEFNNEISYISPYSEIYADSNQSYPEGILLDEKTNPDDSYKAQNDLIAAYVALKIPIGARLNVYGGVRMENNRAWLYDFYAEPTMDSLDVIIDTLNLFPSVNISFDLSEKTKLRLAYGTTINRPEFREIAPYSYYDFETASQMYGNPDLSNAYIANYDFRFEWYPSIGEMITFGVFYKDFKDPIENTLIPASTDKWTFRPENATEAESYGVEVDIKKSFMFLSESNGFLRSFRHFALVFNASRIWSEMIEGKVYKRDEKRPMQGQSPYIINAGLYYDNQEIGLLASLLYNQIGERIIYVGDPSTPHTYEQPRDDLELAINKKLGNHFTIKAGFENILDAEFRLTQTIEFEKSADGNGATTTVEEERVLKSFKPGRKFSLGISYTF